MSAANSQRLESLAATQAFAQRVAMAVRAGDTLLLMGDLGAGKTTFTQSLVAALSPTPVEVTSPTFTLVQHYPIITAEGAHTELFHYDLYRIDEASALIELGIDEAESGVRVIEWPECLGAAFAPRSWLAITLHIGEDGARNASWRAGGALAQRLAHVA